MERTEEDAVENNNTSGHSLHSMHKLCQFVQLSIESEKRFGASDEGLLGLTCTGRGEGFDGMINDR